MHSRSIHFLIWRASLYSHLNVSGFIFSVLIYSSINLPSSIFFLHAIWSDLIASITWLWHYLVCVLKCLARFEDIMDLLQTGHILYLYFPIWILQWVWSFTLSLLIFFRQVEHQQYLFRPIAKTFKLLITANQFKILLH